MTEFLAPLNYDRARDVLRRLSLYRNYSPEGARQAREVLRQHYPRIFERLESKTFDNGALLLEMPGANIAGPLVFVSHLDAPEGTPRRRWACRFRARIWCLFWRRWKRCWARATIPAAI